jgi:cytochrome c-type biogenesis protein CcmH
MAGVIGGRHFVAALAGGATVAAARALGAQDAAAQGGTSMSGDGYLPVRLAPKANATRQLTDDQRDALEHQLSCPCPCTLDVYTCRTSMPCGFSPRLHADVISLVEGGYTGDEIIAAFVGVYGDQARMAPPTHGFNLVGWVAPFAALGTGALVIAALIRRWGRQAADRRGPSPLPVDAGASADELARLEAAIRDDH